ncbi:unnamed protein product [Prorocentrum cordatum]|uniref:Uncharacterized protein n=1 Tax=Prorocentrum cordatum TaxID=2364126 RepID=A0ABN9SK86_9DINO|nr:unnamed protein product [Polarella glacialis]
MAPSYEWLDWRPDPSRIDCALLARYLREVSDRPSTAIPEFSPPLIGKPSLEELDIDPVVPSCRSLIVAHQLHQVATQDGMMSDSEYSCTFEQKPLLGDELLRRGILDSATITREYYLDHDEYGHQAVQYDGFDAATSLDLSLPPRVGEAFIETVAITTKLRLCDIEDFPGAPAAGHQGGAAGAEAPLVAFGRGPKRWLEAQRLRWQATPQASLAAAGGWRQSLFHEASAWAPLSAETLRSEWHVVSMEPAQVLRSGSDLRAGDAVLVNPDDEEEATIDELSAGELQPGKVVGFVGGLVRVALETGEERLLSRGAVRPAKEEGLFVCWVSTGLGLSLHRCELLARRRVVLALESDFSPEGARCAVKPAELVKGLRVWPRQPNERRVGPGLLTSAAPEIGLCSVTWESGVVEAVFAADLERQGGSAARVLRDPPRNMQHACLIELEMAEDEFQRQRHEGSLGDRDESWPRIDSVYEAEQPLDFDVRCRLGATVKLVAPEKAEAGLGRGLLRLSLEDTTRVPHGGYLAGLVPQRNVYVHLCFDAARPSRAFCGIFSPILAEAWACFGGIDPAEGETMRPALEQALAEQLAQSAGGDRDDLSFVRAEASFVSGKSLSAIAQWIDTRLEDVRQRDGGHVCVLCSQLPAAELRGLSQSLYIDHRHQRRLSALREMPAMSDTQPWLCLLLALAALCRLPAPARSLEAADYLAEEYFPGLHLLDVGPSDVRIYKDCQRPRDGEPIAVRAGWATMEAARAAFESALGIMPPEPLQTPWAFFDAQGTRLETVEALLGLRVAFLLEIGVWMWPAVRVGFVQEATGVLEGRPLRLKTLSLRPVIFEVEGFIRHEEADAVIGMGKHMDMHDRGRCAWHRRQG